MGETKFLDETGTKYLISRMYDSITTKELKLTSLSTTDPDITDDNVVFKGVSSDNSPFTNTGAEIINIGLTYSGYRLVSQLAMPYNGITAQSNNEMLKIRSYHSASGWSSWHNVPICDFSNTFTGVNKFKKYINCDEINNINDNALIRYKSTENKVVLGGSTIPTTIMGNEKRPNYSANGSDFTGAPLALKSDVPTFSLNGTVLTITWNED